MVSKGKIAAHFSRLRNSVITFCFMAISLASFAHGTQTAYCVTDGGRIRVWIEHWHGNLSSAQTANALVRIDVFDASTSTTTTYNTIPTGVVWDTPIGSLPGCKGPMTVLSTCPGRSNVYNDWVYWDFAPPACFVNLTITIVSISGSQSWIFDEACAALYPVTFTDSFIDCVPPDVVCPADKNYEVNTSDCQAMITDGLQPTVIFDDCTPLEDLQISYVITGALEATGTGYANGLIYPKGMSTITYTVTDNTDKSTICSTTINVVDTSKPKMTCPATLALECGGDLNSSAITQWLAEVEATDNCGIQSITNNYDPDGFAYQDSKDNKGFSINPYSAVGNPMMSKITSLSKIADLVDCNEESTFTLKEISGSDLFDYPVKIRIEGIDTGILNKEVFAIFDDQRRIVPFWVENKTIAYADVWLKIPELKANSKKEFLFKYGQCEAIKYEKENIFGEEITPETQAFASKVPFAEGEFIRNADFQVQKIKDFPSLSNAKMMDCNCTATQGSQTFNINTLQNAEDDVSFYQYGTPNGASANTGLEMNDAAILFLYENTLTGEISLFIILDAAGGGNGGRGSIDFFCLPPTATLDFSDDNGEITGIFPTVTASWRWIDCCTDGALIGNVGCNTTFDFYPQFVSGINQIKWVSGTLASPVFTTFNSSSAPVRITCGDAQPTCCPNSNSVDITDASCPDDSDGAVNVTIDPAGAPYTYVWSTGATTQDVSGLTPGTYTVTITDKNDCEQIINNEVNSDEKPELNCPANVTLTYMSDTLDVNLTDLGYTISYDCPNDVTETCIGCGTYVCSDSNTTIPVTVNIQDELGNTDQCIINVTLLNPGPAIKCPDNLMLECGYDLNSSAITQWLGTATSDDMDLNEITNNYNPDGFSFSHEKDENNIIGTSGKQSTQTGPKDFYFQLTQNMMAPLETKGKQLVTFVATDVCGNTSSCQATIVIDDTTDPEMDCPDDITLECGDPNNDAIITNWLASVSAVDQCDLNPDITNNYAASFPGGCDGPTGVRTVTFTSRDDCGNTATCTARITIDDSTPPEFMMKPQDISVQCINNTGNTAALTDWVKNNGGGMALDDCDPTVTWSATAGTSTNDCGFTTSIPYTFTITDNCGNMATAMATFTVIDEIPPMINVPADRSFACNPATNIVSINNVLDDATVTDVCSAASDIELNWELFNRFDGCGGTFTEVYQYTATDACGNSSTALIEFEIVDNVPPVGSGIPGNLTIQCGDIDNPTLINDWLTDIENAYADACGGSVMVTNNWNGDINEGCGTLTTLVFTIVDECSNRTTLNRTISYIDNINPVFENCPANITVNVDVDVCGSRVIFSTPSAFDQCSDPVQVIQTVGPASGSEFPVGTTTVTFEAVDACGNRSNPDCSYTITVIDSDIPSIQCPDNLEICTDEGRCTWTSDKTIDPIGNDNCGLKEIKFEITGATTASGEKSAAGTIFNLGISTVCYTTSDGVNDASCCFTVTVTDCEAPRMRCPANILNAVCGSSIPATFIVEARDNCDADVTITSQVYNTMSGCGDTNIQIIEFTATDDAGNTAVCYAQYGTIDNIAPTITTPASAGVSTCDDADADLLDWLNTNGGAAATDACGDVAWSYNFVGGASTGCSGVPSLTVDFIATDQCGNASTTRAVFSVDDNVAPTISCPIDITLECGDPANDAIIDLWAENVQTDDNCSEVTVKNNLETAFTAGCGDTGIYNVTFTATDDCGNEATCMARITIEDSLAPTFIMKPQDLYVECDGEGNADNIKAWITNNGGGMAQDECTRDVKWSADQTGADDECGNTVTLEFEFTVTDECDNEAITTAFVYIQDSTGPSISIPRDQMVSCNPDTNDDDLDTWLDSATASDICSDEVDISKTLFNSISACGGGQTETYLFTATDDCGNQTTALASYTINDDVAPIISCPDDLMLECGMPNNGQLITAWLASATAADACSDVTVSHNYTGLLPKNCGGSLTVVFTATDDCGNQTTCMADIIMDDNTIPDFVNCPLEDITINVDVDECGSNPIFSTPIAVDNCDVTVMQTAGLTSGSEFPVGTTNVEFTATDECGNQITCEFNIIVVDSDIPSVHCPSNDVEACVDAGLCTWESENIAPFIEENCDYKYSYNITGATTATGTGDASGTVFVLGVSTVCYTIEDENGNEDSCCFTVIVTDCEAPEISCPKDLIVECDGNGNEDDLKDWLISVTARDNCEDSPEMMSRLFNDVSGCGQTSTQVYEFTATDNFGNTSICYASFTIRDTTDPVIDAAAANLTVECDGAGNSNDLNIWLDTYAGAEASDICGDVKWSHDYNLGLTDLCGETGTVTVIFTATDECGNTANTQATFTIEDTTDPIFNCPQDIVLDCGDLANDAIIENWLATTTSEDDCSSVNVSNDYDDKFEAACGKTGTYTVTFTATDECDNETTCEATITIIDETAPVITVAPQDLVVDCAADNIPDVLSDWLVNNGGAMAFDKCDDDLTWTSQAGEPLTICGDTQSTPYVFTVTDDCGNETTTSANFITEDFTGPEISLPKDLTVECDGERNTDDLQDWLDSVAASDDCSDEPTISIDLYNSISACGNGFTEVYIFTATDACGNNTTGLASFTVDDEINPMITCPEDLELECGDAANDQIILAWLTQATATDICSDVSVTADYPGALPNDCDGSLTVTFTATDDCGNTFQCTADILMDDSTDPIFVNCPTEDLTINVDVDECGSNPIFSTPMAEDNCTVTVAQTEGPTSGSEFELGTTLVEFTATDACGNTAICQFNIIVVDSDVPTILCPSTTIVECTDSNTCTWTSDKTIDPSANFENCPDAVVTYTISGATTASGFNSAAGEVFNLGRSTICYSIEDDSGNTDGCCFDIIIEDCQAPNLVCPANRILECAATNEVDLNTWLNSAVSTDNCDIAPEITVTLWNSISGCGNTQSDVYLFAATDDFGNQTTCIRSFEIQDNTAPVITTSIADVTVECDGNGNTAQLLTWLEDNGNIPDSDVTEFCTNYEWQNNFETVSFSTNTSCADDLGSYQVKFWVVDDCGNVSNQIIKTFTIEDTTDPNLVVPDDITLECGDSSNDAIIAAWINDFSVADICDSDVTVVVSNSVVEQCGLTSTTTYTFTATDNCGNEVDDTATVTIVDTTNPIIEAPASDLVLECADENNGDLIDAWLANNGGAVASDACSDEDLAWANEASATIGSCGDTGTTLYTFTVTDNCGNESTTTASVIINDTTVPELTLPEGQIEECGDIEVSLADWQSEASATDECGTPSISVVLWNTISGCGGTQTEEYLFTATDNCGNTSTGIATYETEDTSDPTIVCPADLALVCGDENNDQIIINWLASATATDEFDCSRVEITHDYPSGLPSPLDCNGGEGIVVTFTATDACGNTDECTATITMDDEDDPYFLNCPDDLTVNVDVDLCENNVVYSTPIALDNCDEEVAVALIAGPASGTAFPLGTTTVTFEATDDCGNTSICSFDITVIDSDVPSIDCPSNDVVVCTDEDSCTWEATSATDPIYNDNCPGLDVSYTIAGATTASGNADAVNTVAGDGVVFNLGTSTVTYTITDPSGNESSCSFDVIVEDCQSPTITCNDQLNIACGEEDLTTWFNGIAATASDNCNTNAELSVDTLLLTDFSSCGNTFERVYLFTVTDEAGNTSTCTAIYETDDTVNPIVETPASDLTLECNDGNQSTALQAWLNNHGGASASDVCSGPVTWTNNFTTDLTPVCGTNGTVTVVFTATDDCGNSSTTSAIFTIEDTTAPVLECPSNITLECGGDLNEEIIDGWLAQATSEDACEGTLTVTNDYDENFVDACGLTGEYTVNFTTTDACNNESTCSRTITIVDTTDPVIEIEASDLVLECADENNGDLIDAWLASNGGAVASDACSDEDLEWANEASATIGSCGDTGTTLYTFTVTDNCGNESTTSASVIINDTTVPELTLPEGQIEECGDIEVSLADWQSEASATDECGTPSISVVLWNTISGCGGTQTEEYLFTATDNCGNTSTGIATYETEDTSDPTIVCPADLALVCGDENNDQIIINWLASATATDEFDCSTVEITHDYPSGLPSPLECNGGEGIVVTFTATDACGNTDECTATITMDDEDDPYFLNCPDDLTVNVDVDLCENNVVYSTPIALDNCDEEVAVALIAGPASGTAFPLGTTTVTFEATDDCGNTSICSFDITVIDSDVPSIDCPSNDVVVCTDEDSCTWEATSATDPIYNDNCPGLDVSYTITGATMASGTADAVNTVSGDGVVFNLGTSLVTYTITDPSGNSSTCIFTVIVEDCQSPRITCNDQLNIACGEEDLSGWFDGIAATASDNCNANAELRVDTLLLTDFSSCGSTFERVYLFTVTDEAGNTSTCTAIYETDDTVNPVIDTPAIDLTLECNDGNQSTALQAWLNNNGGATASDVCSGPVVWSNNFTSDLTPVCGTNGTVTVIFIATDDCGNSSTTSAIFTIEDTTAPVLSCPSDITLECGGALNEEIIDGWLAQAMSEDACEGTLTVTNDYDDNFVDACGLTGEYTVNFTTTDACNNESTCSRTITIIDTTDPVIEIEASDLVLECADENNGDLIDAWLANNGGAVASDACSDEDLEWESEASATIGSCGDTGTTLYTFTVIDNCGNESTTTASVIIQDTTSPELEAPENETVECNGEGNQDDLTDWLESVDGSDTCGEVVLSWRLFNTISACGGGSEEIYEFITIDECGNETRAIRSFVIEDTTSPIISMPAQDYTAECNGGDNAAEILNWLNSNGGAEASDICSSFSWVNNFGSIETDCGAAGGVEVVFTVTDECGNSSQTSASFIINDTSEPTWEIDPVNLTIICDGSNDPLGEIVAWVNTQGGGEAEDDCSFVTYSNDYAGLSNGCSATTGSALVTFTATDACGNFTERQATVSVIDQTAPMITLEAQDMTVECDGAGNEDELNDWLDAIGGATASDDCSTWEWDDPVLGNTEENCGGTVVYTYSWTATDECGNTSLKTIADFIIEDTTSPSIDQEAIAEIFECDGVGNISEFDMWLDSNGGAEASDICSENLTWEFDLITEVDSCGVNGSHTYRFTVSDACGNSNTTEATIVIKDETAPTITLLPADITIECNGSVNNSTAISFWLDDHGGAEATDACGELFWSHNYAANNPECPGTQVSSIEFTVSDACGNSTTVSADIHIIDTEAPSWQIVPQNLEIECDGSDDPMGQIESWLETGGGADVLDDCSLALITHDFEMIDLECNQEGGVEVTFTATDACGNFTERSALLMITDDVAPEITSPAKDEVVECDGEGNEGQLQDWLEASGNATAQDLCSMDIVWNYTLMNTVEGCGNTSRTTYMFTATDACGNVSANTIADFIIEDSTSPEIEESPEDLVVECDGSGNSADLNTWLLSSAGGVAADICSEPLVWSFDLVETIDQCSNTNVFTYRFTVTDACGNQSSDQATFTIEDTTAPDIAAGDDLTIECDQNNAGNDDELISWLNNNAGATAVEICSNFLWTNDYNFENWVDGCNGSRYVDVTFTATDECGNAASTTHRFGTVDTTAPTFLNCPRPPVVVDAPTGWCNSFVNYAPMQAIDNCGSVTINQIDDSGLSSGDLFPVGLTILTFEAIDACGNADTCELKIIVNDFHTPPTIQACNEVTINTDQGSCTAIVDNIPPGVYEDNCPDNTFVMYEILDANGDLVSCGFSDASGSTFPAGTNTVNYTVFDQPLLLITEIVQDGVVSGVEITNFGPATLDITCLDIVRLTGVNELFNVPNGTFLGVGDVYTHEFSNVAAGLAAGYYISFAGYVIDFVALNGFSLSSFAFDGSISGNNIYRNIECDHDSAADWTVADNCFEGSYGVFNPGLSTIADNGNMASLQGAAPSSATTSCLITVLDDEAPYCIGQDTVSRAIDDIFEIEPGACSTFDFSIATSFDIVDVNVTRLLISVADASDIYATLVSPAGTEINLFGGMCSETSDILIGLDDSAPLDFSTLACAPMGNDQIYQAIDSFKDLYGENALGTWSLAVSNAGETSALVELLEIDFITEQDYNNEDVEIRNDPGLCGALYEWSHPYIGDNCCDGSMTVSYTSEDDIEVPNSGDVIPGSAASEFFEVGTTTVTYTITDAAGNMSECSFDITVVDIENPVIDGLFCEDVRAQIGEAACAMLLRDLIVDFPIPTDNCGIEEIVFEPSLDDIVDVGTHEVTITVYDVNGNAISCMFNLEVRGFEGLANIGDGVSCLGSVNLSLGADCTATITPDMLLASDLAFCVDDYCVFIEDEQGNVLGSSEDGTNVFDQSHVGQCFNVRICNSCDDAANCCWGRVCVEEKLFPGIDCPADVTIACNAGFDPDDIEAAYPSEGYPELLTCEKNVYFNYVDEYVDNGPCAIGAIRAEITRNWTITDDTGNEVTCAQIISIMPIDVADIVYPMDMTLETGIDCEDVMLDPEKTHPDYTGYPKLGVGGPPISDVGEGLCMHSWNWDDQILKNCEGTYEILRKWIVRDMCEDISATNPHTEYQVIKVVDRSPPILTCPHDLTISAGSYDCDAGFDMRPYLERIEDACGSVREFFVFASGGTIVRNPDDKYDVRIAKLALGDHTIKIRAKDQCSNYDECEFTLTVVDNVPPVVVCDQHTSISLTDNEFTYVPAEVFDDGTFDNCTGVKLQVYRMDDLCSDEEIIPRDSVRFCCLDAAQTEIMVVLRAWDDADHDGVYGTDGDNFAECMVSVVIDDKIPAVLTCPDHVTIQCYESHEDLELTGIAEIRSNCGQYTSDYEDVVDVNQCNMGVVQRTWFIEGTNPRIECVQWITLENKDLFDGTIDFPRDLTVSCLEDALDLVPEFSEQSCSLIGYVLESDTFDFDTDGCFKVLNKWTVIDWCQYNPITEKGVWTEPQTIKVVDEVPPVITDCETISFGLNSSSCEAGTIGVKASATDDSCGSRQRLKWVYHVDLNQNGIYDITGELVGEDVDLVLHDIPVGIHHILWSVRDGCDNQSTCQQQIMVEDQEAPQAYCITQLTTSLDHATQTAVIWASDFDGGSNDNCTAQDDLQISFSGDQDVRSLTFDCSDIENGVQDTVDVQMWVTDSFGNPSFCSAQLIIQDIHNVCPDQGSEFVADIAGEVSSLSNLTLSDVEIKLMDRLGNQVNSMMTENQFAFYNLPMYKDYLVQPYKDNLWRQGLSTLDIVVLQKHILGIQKFDHPAQYIAGDMNHDERLSTIDIVTLRKLILENISDVPQNTSWRFVDNQYDWSNTIPWIIPETIEIENLETQMMDNDFTGIKIGDIYGITSSNSQSVIETKSRDISTLKYSLTAVQDGKVQVNIIADRNYDLLGMQTALSIYGGRYDHIVSGKLDIATDHIHQKGNTKSTINLSWSSGNLVEVIEGDILFSLMVNSEDITQIWLSKDDKSLNSEMYVKDLEIKELRFEKLDLVQAFAVHQNNPNPFRSETEISFILPVNQEMSFEIFDVNSRLVYSEIMDGQTGQNIIKLNKAKLNLNSGVYVYRISGGELSDQKNMIVIK